MAKQSGLHQLRGKVGEYSYYRQTGVVPGLVRSINQGLSSRVKTGSEYANTRLSNAEFGQACRIAGVLGHLIMPKFRPMVLPFSQSKMAKIILDAIKTTTGNFGQRSIPSGTAGKQVLLDALTSVRKNNPSDLGISLDVSNAEVGFIGDDTSLSEYLNSIGADHLNVSVVRNNVQVGNYTSAIGGYQYSYRVYNRASVTAAPDDYPTAEITTPTLPPVPEGQAEVFEIVVAVLMPVRVINNEEHILQEYCTFIVA